jgi:hypothetical protein
LRGAKSARGAKVVDHRAAPFQRTCDHPVICTPSINCTPPAAVSLAARSLRARLRLRAVRRPVDCSSSLASVVAGSAEVTASTGSSGAPVGSAGPVARLSCMDTSSRRVAAASSRMQERDVLRSRDARRLDLVPSGRLAGVGGDARIPAKAVARDFGRRDYRCERRAGAHIGTAQPRGEQGT